MAKSINIATQANDGQAILDMIAQADRAITQLVSLKTNLVALRTKISDSLAANEGIYDASDVTDINTKLSALATRIQTELLA